MCDYLTAIPDTPVRIKIAQYCQLLGVTLTLSKTIAMEQKQTRYKRSAIMISKKEARNSTGQLIYENNAT